MLDVSDMSTMANPVAVALVGVSLASDLYLLIRKCVLTEALNINSYWTYNSFAPNYFKACDEVIFLQLIVVFTIVRYIYSHNRMYELLWKRQIVKRG